MTWPWAVVIIVCVPCLCLTLIGIFTNSKPKKRDDDINF